jgi:Methyltransferase FkbM domain/Putative transposase
MPQSGRRPQHQTLQHLPHVHRVVPGGGPSLDGTRWVTCRSGFLLPVHVLGRLFRRLFLRELENAFNAGKLRFFTNLANLAEPQAPQFSRAMVRLETLDRIWAGKRRLDAAKVDIEGHEAKFLQGGRKTITSHRPVILMEVNRWHHEQRGVDFDTIIPSLLPDRYAFAALRSGAIVQIDNIAQCADTDVLAVPEERLHEIDRRS